MSRSKNQKGRKGQATNYQKNHPKTPLFMGVGFYDDGPGQPGHLHVVSAAYCLFQFSEEES